MRGFGSVGALAAAAVLLSASPAGASGWTVVPSIGVVSNLTLRNG
jgi:hypothetical protein